KSLSTYVWSFCGHAVYAPNDPALQTVPDSGGGLGLKTTVTITVTNPGTLGAKQGTISDVQASWGISSDVFFPPGCSSTDPTLGPNPQYAYPMEWSSS